MTGGGEPEAAFLSALTTDEQGEPEVGLHWENVLVHSGVSFKIIPWEDMVLLPASARAPEEVRGVGERLMIRGTELAAGVKTGRYLKEAVNQILQGSAGQQPADRGRPLTPPGDGPQPR